MRSGQNGVARECAFESGEQRKWESFEASLSFVVGGPHELVWGTERCS